MEPTRIMKSEKVQAYRFECADCHQVVIHSTRNTCTTGYATCRDGSVICFRCCANRDRQAMVDTGHSRNLPLYLTERKVAADGIPRFHVSNWPGTLIIPVWGYRISNRGHNWGLKRVDVWFNGPDGHVWHGYQLGNFSQIVHCKRTKEKVKQAA